MSLDKLWNVFDLISHNVLFHPSKFYVESIQDLMQPCEKGRTKEPNSFRQTTYAE